MWVLILWAIIICGISFKIGMYFGTTIVAEEEIQS